MYGLTMYSQGLAGLGRWDLGPDQRHFKGDSGGLPRGREVVVSGGWGLGFGV